MLGIYLYVINLKGFYWTAVGLLVWSVSVLLCGCGLYECTACKMWEKTEMATMVYALKLVIVILLCCLKLPNNVSMYVHINDHW